MYDVAHQSPLLPYHRRTLPLRLHHTLILILAFRLAFQTLIELRTRIHIAGCRTSTPYPPVCICPAELFELLVLSREPTNRLLRLRALFGIWTMFLLVASCFLVKVRFSFSNRLVFLDISSISFRKVKNRSLLLLRVSSTCFRGQSVTKLTNESRQPDT